MPDPRSAHPRTDLEAKPMHDDLRTIEALIDEHVLVDCHLVPIDAQTWAIHGFIAVEGDVIVAEFTDPCEAEAAIERIEAAERRAAASRRATAAPA
jgi:hypothetical protein